MLRTIATLTLVGGLSLFGQATKGAWWSRPAIKDLNLSRPQMREMRETMQEYRPRLLEARAAVQKAEEDLESEFNHDPVDMQKANAAIDRLVTARADLTRTLSRMGLKLRTVLTVQQWQEVEKRFPAKNPGKEPAAH
jgi:Spy/CpxP family protein refolding chaperone